MSAGSGGNGVCGEGREDRPGVWGAGLQGTSDPEAPARTRPLPGSRPVPPLHPDPSFLPLSKFGQVFDRFHLAGSTPLPPSSHLSFPILPFPLQPSFPLSPFRKGLLSLPLTLSSRQWVSVSTRIKRNLEKSVSSALSR